MSNTEVKNYKSENAEGEISLTPAAIAEIKRLIAQQENPDGLMLRVGIQGGGCSGLSYKMEFSRQVEEFDNTFEFDGLSVVIDAKALAYMSGTTIDFNTELLNGGFKFDNPMSTRSCGCGSSFSV
jgi:iron-sulfur cluster assembly protein